MSKRIFPLLLAIMLLISACSGGGIRVHIEKKQYESDSLMVNVQIPQLSGMEHTDLQDTLNNQYKADIDGWIAEMQKQADEGDGEHPYELVVTQNVKENKEGFLSFVTEVYQYTGGAHGITTWIAENIDDNAGKEITLADLFTEGEDYKTVLNRIMREMVENDPGQYQDLWEQPVIGDKQGFYIQNNKLVIYYPPYELSYYARGFVEFPIPLEDIETYLKPEYKFLV